jgi:acetyl-CoA C-acetyltransferase
MSDVVIIEAVRTPVGRRGGGLSGAHPADLLGTVLNEVIQRSGIDPAQVGQVVAGCVSQVGEQSFNIARTAWLSAGLPQGIAATTVDTQCGSSQQATNVATALVAAGVVDVAVASGVEVMSRVPIGSNSSKKLGLGVPIPKTYFGRYEFTSQFEGAERIAEKWGITRADTDEFGLASQQRAAQAWSEGRFDSQIVTVDAPSLDDEGAPTGGPTSSPATRACASRASRSWASSSRWPGPTASTPPARRRRSATVPAPCCSPPPRRRPSWASPRGPGSSTPAWWASTPCSC